MTLAKKIYQELFKHQKLDKIDKLEERLESLRKNVIISVENQTIILQEIVKTFEIINWKMGCITKIIANKTNIPLEEIEEEYAEILKDTVKAIDEVNNLINQVNKNKLN